MGTLIGLDDSVEATQMESESGEHAYHEISSDAMYRTEKITMSAMSTIRGLVVALTLVASAAHAQRTDYWGARLPDQPTQFIFGYGSLIDTPSRDETAGKHI